MGDAVLEKSRDTIREWRVEMLVELGFTPEDAAYLAAVRDLDWHEAERLVRLGCPSELVLEILM
jgi:hypothetical protein